MQVIPVSDGTRKLPPQYFANSDWGPHQELIGPDGMVTGQLACFVVRTGDTTVLIDAGVGPYDNAFFQCGQLPESLRAAGVERDEIDIVVCTHLHLDHAGWLVQDGEPFFPMPPFASARPTGDQLIDAPEAVQWIHDGMTLLAERGRLEPITIDGESIAPGINARSTPGLTHGHTVFVISSDTERIVVLGDAVTCPVQLEEPDWQAISDVDHPALAAHARGAAP